MLDTEGDYFLTFVVDEDRVMYQGGMTPLQIAAAIFDEKKVQVRLMREPGNRILHVFVYLSLYEEILRQMGLRECVELVAESDEDDEEGFDQEIYYVITLAQLSDGRWVEIAVDYNELASFVDSQPDETQFDLNYRTRFALGEASKFINLLVPLEIGLLLDGVDACYLVDTN